MNEQVKVVRVFFVTGDREEAVAFASHHKGAVVEAMPGEPPRWEVAYLVPEDMLTEGLLGGSPPEP